MKATVSMIKEWEAWCPDCGDGSGVMTDRDGAGEWALLHNAREHPPRAHARVRRKALGGP